MFVGLAALISALTGMLGGSVPKIFDLFQQRLTFAQELKIREMDAKFRREEQQMQILLAEKGISGKIEESYYEALKSEVEANAQMAIELARQMNVPSGYAFIDAVNASLRPFFFLGTMLLFFIVIIQFMVASPEVLAAQAAAQFWMAVEGVVGFLAGYRSVVKPSTK